MKYIRQGIVFFLLFVGFLLISCNAMIYNKTSATSKDATISTQELHSNLLEKDKNTSSELEKAHDFELEKREAAKANLSQNPSETLPYESQESEMMKAAKKELKSYP